VSLAAAVSLGLVFTAFSYCNDTEASIENSFTVGTWAVSVNGRGDSAYYNFKNLAGGSCGTLIWEITNTGTVPAFTDMDIGIVENGTGNLGDYLKARLYISDGDDICPDAAINTLAGPYDLDLPLDAGEAVMIMLDWIVDSGYFPDTNDQVKITLNFSISPAP
jgi:hypothetical protein